MATPSSTDPFAQQEQLRHDVERLAGEIGERNIYRYAQLYEEAAFIEQSFRRRRIPADPAGIPGAGQKLRKPSSRTDGGDFSASDDCHRRDLAL
jgi:hypothetical protein